MLAHLSSRLAKARPTQAKLRPCPLQEGHAIRIVHDIADFILAMAAVRTHRVGSSACKKELRSVSTD
jgi:hypothetical protein